MLKPGLVRNHLHTAIPEFRRDPDKLHIFASEGKVVATGARSLSFEYQYTLNIIITDYAGHADAVIVPLLAWLRVHQPDLVTNQERRRHGFRFEVEYLNQQSVDLAIELDLTERVVVTKDGARIQADHRDEPPDPDIVLMDEEVELWVRDEHVATWRIDAWPI